LKEELKRRFEDAVKIKKVGDLTSARKLFIELADEDKKSPAILAVLGDICWEMNLLDEAVVAFAAATKLSPKLEAVSLGLFHCLWELGKRELALEEIKRFQTVSDSPDYREIIREINDKSE
jgi:predicted Zn-dependent protease